MIRHNVYTCIEQAFSLLVGTYIDAQDTSAMPVWKETFAMICKPSFGPLGAFLPATDEELTFVIV